LIIGCILVLIILAAFLFDWRTALISSTAIPLSLVAAAASVITVPYLGEEFMPKFQEYDFLMHWVEKSGTSIEAMDRITVRASQELRSIDGVRNFGSHIGRAEVADEVVGPNFTELWISLDRDVDHQNKVAEIQEVVDGYPGLYRDLLTYLRERIKEVRGRDLGSVARDIESRVRQLDFDRGYHPEFLGEYAAQQESRRRLIVMGAIALAGIVVLLYSEFRAWRLVILVMLGFLFAVIGGVLGVWLGGGDLSLGSLVGFVTVVGIAVRNGIMMISHFRHLEEQEGMAFGDELTIRGAEERLAPILMTALTAALALLPLAIAGNRPGHEIEYPMALVILGGLLSSTLMNLFFVPTLYRAFGNVQVRLDADE
jgi:Cu/Ag efflux pump CusA